MKIAISMLLGAKKELKYESTALITHPKMDHMKMSLIKDANMNIAIHELNQIINTTVIAHSVSAIFSLTIQKPEITRPKKDCFTTS
jgi:hypothetical protein